ncbi:outer membrane usher protein [Serratia marcescens]|uniref:outer membrane usher protein n=1 Tax=Serratia marcescens TaxID=615 RepID=UPI0039839894
MIFSPAGKPLRFHMISVCVAVAVSGLGLPFASTAVEDIQFNLDVLDVNDRKNIDLSHFSRAGFIMPGSYSMAVHVNKMDLPEQQITFYVPHDDPKSSRVCLARDLVSRLGLKENLLKQLVWWRQGECLDESSLPGVTARGDLATSSLYLSIPQAYLEYISEDWEPPSRWDEGVSGILIDYNVNTQTQHQMRNDVREYRASGNGKVGANLGAWRLRADWQANLNHQTGSPTNNRLEWSRYYAYRALPALRAKLIVGESYLDSGLFDSFRFGGVSLRSDDNMLPPNLRGYAPEVTGVAKSNAKVTISQQGRVLYETQVAAGPFRIQDINDAISGELNVRIEEQDGNVQEFQMNTASIPYLTRPGSVRYKLAAGQPSDIDHRYYGPLFGTGEVAWGVSNGWSLYGGALLGGDYNALALGIGRDLMLLGALSFDVTQSRAVLPQNNETLSGGSYRLSYSKTFDELDSQVTFAGYRFSEENFMSMGEYLEAREYGQRLGNSKEMYTVTFNQQLRDLGMSLYLDYNHQTYWDRPANDRYSLTASRYFDIGRFKNLNMSLSAYRSRYDQRNDDGMYLSLSIPWGSGTLGYNATLNRRDVINRASYYARIDERNNYQLSAGGSRHGANISGYYNHDGDAVRLNASASHQQNRYSALGVSAQGGMTLTPQGGALHRIGMAGGTRLLLDADGVAGVPVRGYGSAVATNRWGKAVVADVSSYYRNKASIDLARLSDNAEATQSVVQATLTEGAIGYRRFKVIAGEKAMAVIKLANGGEPPFGAKVLNARRQETGIINDGGSVYLSGIKAGETMTVHWDGVAQCEVHMPAQLPQEMLVNNLLLPCRETNRVSPSQTEGGV